MLHQNYLLRFGDNVVTVSFLSGAVPIPESEIKPHVAVVVKIQLCLC